MSKLVITGGLGFIGSEFVNLIFQEDNEYDYDNVLVIDKNTYAADASRIQDHFGKFDVLFKNICDVTLDDIDTNVEYIVNFAAETHVDNSIENGRPFVRTNIEGTFNLLEVARQLPNFKKFVQISTDEVYGDMPIPLISQEDDILDPSSPYSATKASADLLVKAVHRTYKLPYLILRPCNNYGEKQDKENFIPKMIECVKTGQPYPLYGDGTQIREWIYVKDTVKIINRLLHMPQAEGIYNLGSGMKFTNLAILHYVSEITGGCLEWRHVEDRKGHDKRYALNITKLENLLQEYSSDKFTHICDWLYDHPDINKFVYE